MAHCGAVCCSVIRILNDRGRSLFKHFLFSKILFGKRPGTFGFAILISILMTISVSSPENRLSISIRPRMEKSHCGRTRE